jgi:hypothetical protein
MDDVASGAVKYLAGFSDVTSLLGSYPGSDPRPSFAGRPWLFSDNSQGVLKVMEGTSAAALVFSDFGGWEAPAPLATARFRRLRVDVWVDPARDAQANVTETSSITANRGLAVFNAVQFRLQRTDPDAVLWGDMVTIGCQLLTDIGPFLPVTDGDWLLRGTAYYGVEYSGWSDATE